MTDRELLALAAKAAGLTGEWWERYPGEWCLSMRGEGNSPPTNWDPLIDDGDALRLAVDLKLMVDNCGPFSECAGFVGKGDDMRRIGCEELHEHHGGDAYAATRRAIVRAAAAIGATQDTGAAS